MLVIALLFKLLECKPDSVALRKCKVLKQAIKSFKILVQELYVFKIKTEFDSRSQRLPRHLIEMMKGIRKVTESTL